MLNNLDDLNEFLLNNNICLVVKRHAFKSDVWSIKESESISFLTNEMLHDKKLDFYEVLGASDILITDYSSVYFDFYC